MTQPVPTPLVGFAGNFPPDARVRGASLLSRGGVQILSRSADGVAARAGSLPYYNVDVRVIVLAALPLLRSGTSVHHQTYANEFHVLATVPARTLSVWYAAAYDGT